MPCGGIYPTVRSDAPCFLCGGGGTDHALIEWDSALHGECVQPFLDTEEGQIVLRHKHWVIVDLNGSGNRKVVQKGDALEFFVTEDDITATTDRRV